ncbi:hypothetical protein EAG_10849 [Camponotus floridanus]|uniref:Uncharacterized protein n=1 Tax=Camponotus floridanus TaxID=104421 RepID=E2A9J7_CAMFO|nr:hypothetical protein EAG_10849 [Camponotus floridanus]
MVARSTRFNGVQRGRDRSTGEAEKLTRSVGDLLSTLTAAPWSEERMKAADKIDERKRGKRGHVATIDKYPSSEFFGILSSSSPSARRYSRCRDKFLHRRCLGDK